MQAFIPNPDFSEFEVLKRPCAERESRIFKTSPEKAGTCYRAYNLTLAREQYGRALVILIQHGGGKEALRVGNVYGLEADWLLEIADERRLYAALWSLYKTADAARTDAAQTTAHKYCEAFATGRLKKRRRNRRLYVEIEAPAMPATADAA